MIAYAILEDIQPVFPIPSTTTKYVQSSELMLLAVEDRASEVCKNTSIENKTKGGYIGISTTALGVWNVRAGELRGD